MEPDAASCGWPDEVPRTSILTAVDEAASAGGTLHLADDPEGLTVDRLWRAAGERAAWLHAERRQADVIAGFMDPTPDCLATLLGCWRAGRTFVSLPHRARGMRPDTHADLVADLVGRSGASMVLAPEGPGLGHLDGTVPYSSLGARTTGAEGEGGATLLQFTSGTTGAPRGIVLGMDELGANARSIQLALAMSAADVFVSWLPMSHDMGLVGMFLAPLAAFSVDAGGGRRPSLWISRPDGFLRDPGSWLRTVDEVGATVTMAASFALDLAAGRAARHPELDVSTLRCVIVGAETVRPSSLARAEEVLGRCGLRPGVLCAGYGLAEATLGVTTVRPGERWRTAPDPSGGSIDDTPVVSLGRPLPGTSVRIAGAEGWGPIEVTSPSLGTAVPDPTANRTADGWLVTGDSGFLHDGELYFVGRDAGRIVVAGRTLDTERLRTHLGRLPGIRPGCCAVVAGPLDADDGPDGYGVVVEPATEHAGDLAALCEAVARHALATVGAMPGAVVVVARGSLPKTPSGKLREGVLRDHLRRGEAEVEHAVRYGRAAAR